MADCDGDNQLRGQELKTVVLSLHPRAVSDDDIAHLWATLNPHGKPYLSWADFLCGMGTVRRDERAAALMDLSRPNEFELISLLIDVQLSEEEAAVLLEGMSLFNRVGIHALQSMQSAQMDPAELQEVLTRAADGRLRVLAPERAARVREHQRRIGVIAFVVAVLTNIVPGLWENYTAFSLETDGTHDLWFVCNDNTTKELQPCAASDIGTIASFWSRNLPVILLSVALEVLILGWVAVRTACAIASEFQYRLYPLNRERYFVADALIRSCFEMGNPKSQVLTAREATATDLDGWIPDADRCRRRVRLFIVGLFLGLKVVILGVFLKKVMAASMDVSTYTIAASYSGLLSSCFWDVLVCMTIMGQVAVTCTGIATAPEVFNEILQHHASDTSTPRLSKPAELCVVRAVAVAIETQGTNAATMDLLLRHAIQFFGLGRSKAIEAPSSPLQSTACFLCELQQLRQDEQLVVMRVLLLAQILDGALEDDELVLWNRVYLAVGRPAPPDEAALCGVACAFRQQEIVDVALLDAALDDDDANDHAAVADFADSFWFRLRKLLLK